MYIVMISSECAPVAKVGGLADVVSGLSHELEIRGNHVELILPKYDCMRYEQIHELRQVYDDLWVPFYHKLVHCSVFFGFVYNRKCFFIEPHSGEISSAGASITGIMTTRKGLPFSAGQRLSSC